MKMLVVTATMNLSHSSECMASWRHTRSIEWELDIIDNSVTNLGVLRSLQLGLEHAAQQGADVIAYLHDDCFIGEVGWDKRVMREFEDKRVGLVGFGGALQHGTDDIYKTPYRLNQLGRFGYLSNVDDAEGHGERFTGECDVAVLDGFALVVRREMLEKAGGWPQDPMLKFHCYDYWLSIMTHKMGYRVRVVGVACRHLGGRTSTTSQYQEWLKGQGTTDQRTHEEGHKFVYEVGRGVLPVRVEHG